MGNNKHASLVLAILSLVCLIVTIVFNPEVTIIKLLLGLSTGYHSISVYSTWKSKQKND